ncbi:unnamed protein product [Trichobilharzia szidati]|nr:unnamed protein product [Trichobilharzia szidati]
MSTHVFSNQCGADPSASEISTTDSLIQEFQEFEAQVYSGALFDRKCRTSTPSAEIKNSQANQTTNISTRTHDSFQQKSYANQKSKGKSDFNETSDIEVDSLDDEPVDHHLAQINLLSKRTENSGNHSSQITGNTSTPSSPAKVSRIPQLIRPAVKPGSRPTTLNSLKLKENANSPVISPQHHLPPQPTVVIPHSSSVTNSNLCSPTTDLGTTRVSSRRSQYFVPNLLLSPSDMTKSQKFQLKTTESNAPTPTQLSPSVDSINNSKPCSTNRVKVTVKKLAASPSQSVNSSDSSYGQINKINPDTVASYAQEDPIETHDLVVAKMVADGVVWIPTSSANPTLNTGTKNCQSVTQKTDQLRWYSEEIEEEKVENISITRSNSIPESRQSMKHHSSGSHQNNLTRGGSLNDQDQLGSEQSFHPSSTSTTKGEKEKNNSVNPQQPVTSESLAKQSELEAKLQEAMIIRKQQDDYIKQLQMYYDNLLTKHALAEVTIDQLRMGMRVGIDVDSIDETLQKKATKPRSHSMQTLHYHNNNSSNNNNNPRLISNEDCLQSPRNCYQNRNNNSNDITVHYSSTPLLEQQRNKMRRNSSAHDARVLSTTSESWETGLGSVSNNSSQFVQRNNDDISSKVDLMKNTEKLTSYGQDQAKPGGSVQKIPTEQRSHHRKISEPSPSPSPTTHN